VIPYDYITEWRQFAPWISDEQVEQDLIISRALIEIFKNPILKANLSFRGGTALGKLFFNPAPRYSEDIDLVQIEPKPIGEVIDAIRAVTISWLGKAKLRHNISGIHFVYRVPAERMESYQLRLKIEINTREHFTSLGRTEYEFSMRSRWFQGNAKLLSYRLEELLGTKMRALYQRKKGRDLFDLWYGLQKETIKTQEVVDCFLAYMEQEKVHITRAQYEKNILLKLKNGSYGMDVPPLLRSGIDWDIRRAADSIMKRLIAKLPGEPWKGE